METIETNPQASDLCWICKKNKITFCCMPCRCEILCRNCAKKVCTGGKCKKCKEFICQCRSIIK